MMWIINWFFMTFCVYVGMRLERYLVSRRLSECAHPFVDPKEPTLGD